MRTILNLTIVSVLAAACLGQNRVQDSVPAYRNPKLPIPDRVADLLQRMTLEEKDMHRVVEPGTFDIMVGPSSAETSTVPLQVVQPSFKPAEAPPRK